MSKNSSGVHLHFKDMPKADEKDILAQAKKDGHLGINVDSENLPPVLRQLSTRLIAYKTDSGNRHNPISPPVRLRSLTRKPLITSIKSGLTSQIKHSCRTT